GIAWICAGTLSVGGGGGSGTLGTGDVIDNGTLSLNRSNSYTVANTISGTGGLTKTTAGANTTVTLTGSNSYSGATTIQEGTLEIGAGGTTGSLGTGGVTNNGTLAFNRSDDITVANSISGTGALRKLGANTLTLSGANSYSGGTTVTAGTLQGNAASLQGSIANNGAVVFDQATDGTYAGNMSGSGSLAKQGAGTLMLAGTNSYSGGTTVTGGILLGNTASLPGNIANNAVVVFDQAADGTYAGVMSGTGSLAKQGAGTLTLSASHSYSGGTIVNAGTLTLAPGASLAAGGALAINGGTFNLNGNNQTVGALSGTSGVL